MTDTLRSLAPAQTRKTHVLGQLPHTAGSTQPTLVVTAGITPLCGHMHLDEPDDIAAALAALHDEMTARYLHRRTQGSTGTTVLVILDPTVVSDGNGTVRRLAGDLFRLGLPVGVTVILAGNGPADIAPGAADVTDVQHAPLRPELRSRALPELLDHKQVGHSPHPFDHHDTGTRTLTHEHL